MSDLEGVDYPVARSLELLRTMQCGEEEFARIFSETFTATTSTDKTVELLPGGAHREVTYASRGLYCDLVTQVSYDLKD